MSGGVSLGGSAYIQRGPNVVSEHWREARFFLSDRTVVPAPSVTSKIPRMML